MIWIPVKKALLSRLFDISSEVERQVVSQILLEVLSEVVDTTETGENVVVKVDWLDKLLGEILKTRDHQKLPHTRNS